MSRVPKGRKRSRSALIYALSGIALFACSDPPTAPATTDLDPQFHFTKEPEAPPTILGWQAEARRLVAANNLNPLAAARVYALVSVGQYGAVTDERHKNHRSDPAVSSCANDGPATLSMNRNKRHHRDKGEFEDGALAGASCVILSYLFPAAQSALEQRLADQAVAADHDKQFAKGLELGRRWGAKMIRWASNDHFADPFTGTFPTGPGLWQPNPTGAPAGPLFGKVTPYTLRSGDQFRSPVPPAFGSAAFLTDLAEVRHYSDARTPEQLAIALYWNFGANTITPPGHWNEIASELIEQKGFGERRAAHVFALMNASIMDAFIGCWDSKFYYQYIRPWQVDPSNPMSLPIGTPNHPSYPSGHSCASAAAATVLSRFFPREADELEAKVEEAGRSRVYGAIHYQFDITAGQDLGRSTARYVMRFDQRKGITDRVE
jgi:membrane-associated phospholipid phosphatase